MDDRKENFEEKSFFDKIVSGEVLFPPLVKAKNKIKSLKNT